MEPDIVQIEKSSKNEGKPEVQPHPDRELLVDIRTDQVELKLYKGITSELALKLVKVVFHGR